MLLFIGELKTRSRFFKLKVESINPNSAVMLDLELSKSTRFLATGCPDVAIHVKSTAQGVALASSSCHVPSVHTSWPASRVLHYHTCTSNMAYFRQATSKLFHKIMTSDPAHPSLQFLAECIVHGAPVQVQHRKPRQD